MNAIDWFAMKLAILFAWMREQAILTNGQRAWDTLANRQALAEKWMPFAYGRARLWWQRGPAGIDLDDYRGTAMVPLMQAAMKFDPLHGNDFGCYLGRAIDNYFIRWRPQEAPPTSLTLDDGATLDVPDRHAVDPSEPPEAPPELSDGMRRSLVSLDDVEQYVLCRIEVEGASVSAVAADLGLSATGVAGIHVRALDRLRTAIESQTAQGVLYGYDAELPTLPGTNRLLGSVARQELRRAARQRALDALSEQGELWEESA